MIVFYIYDRWGKQIGTLQNVISAKYADEINGEDALTLEFLDDQLLKGQRIVWRDKFMRWHEHTVSEITENNANGKVLVQAYCENSISELLTDYIVEKEPQGVASAVLSVALSSTRWEIGTVDVAGNHKTSWYHISAYEAVTNIIETWGGELSTSITVEADAITHRKVNIQTRRGSDRGQLFTYGRNLTKVEQKVSSDDVCTALYGYGKGLEQYDEEGNSTGGYSRKLTFGSVNGGQNWVGDEEAKMIWGLPDGHGGIKHTFGQVEFSECEDASELLALTKEALKIRSKPTVTYTGDVVSLAAGGFTNGQDSQTGDTVYIRDKELDLRLEGRVLRVEYDLLKAMNSTITLGNLTRNFSDEYASQRADIDFLKARAAAWDEAAGLTDPFLNAVINSWNEVINADGGYVFWKQGEGITVYDKHPDHNPTKAIQLKGGSFRIANAKTPDGEWDWRTIGTGDGFVADMLVAGTIQGGSNYWNLSTGDLLFVQGGIRDSKNYNYWNLDTGEFKLSSGNVIVDGNSFGNFVAENSEDSFDSATAQQVFDKLTNYGQIQGITMTGGNLYINASNINTGVFSVGRLFTANKTASTVTIADFTVMSGRIVGNSIRLDSNHLIVCSTTENFDIGDVSPSWENENGVSKRFVSLRSYTDSRVVGIAFCVGSSGAGDMAGCYQRSSVNGRSGNSWHFFKPLDMHGNQIKNTNIASAAAIGIGDSIEDEVSFLAPIKINDDGTVAEYAPVKMGYTNGILTSMTKPEEE